MADGGAFRGGRAAAIKVAAAAAVAALVYGYYARYVSVREEVQDLIDGSRSGSGRSGGARAELMRDTPASWLRAEKLLQEALRLHPRNTYAICALADVETLLAGAGFADRVQRAQEARDNAAAKNVSFAEFLEARTLALLQQGKAAEAEVYVRSLLEKYPSAPAVPRFHDLLGRAQRAQGKLQEAKASFKRAQEGDWRQPRFAADHGEALLEDGNPADAIAAFDRALQANPEHLRAQIGKARSQVALARDGRPVDLKSARAALDFVLARDASALTPELRARALAARGEVRLAQDDAAGAAQDAGEALSAQPRLAAALRARALVDAAAKRPAAAQELQAAVAADPFDAATCFDGASALSAAGDLSSAGKLLAACASALPHTARSHLALARLLARKQDAKAAQAELGKALSLEPANALVYYEQGRLLQKQKDRKGAAQAYERAAQLRDDLPDVYRQMGSLYLDARQVADALRAFNGALARYRAARAPQQQLEAFYADVQTSLGRAGQQKLAAQWLKEARAAR